MDSSPLVGAGRVQDTWNLIGRALSAVATCAAKTVGRLLAEVDRLEQWVAAHTAGEELTPALQTALTALRRVLAQDLDPHPASGGRRIRKGVAVDRMPSLGDPEMRHGRKTRTGPFTGYKRHLIKLLGPDLIVDATVRPANAPEHLALAPLLPRVTAQGALAELFLDRGHLASPAIAELSMAGTAIRAKAWTPTNGGRYPKHAFAIDLAQRRVTCLA